MKTWARINSEGKVINLIKIADEKFDVENWLVSRFGGDWVQTYSPEDVTTGTDEVRHNAPAAIGDTWDAENSVFVSDQPFDSWQLSDNFIWEAPVPKPDNEKIYSWDEENINWVEVI